MIEVFAIGSEVLLNGLIDARITGIMIREGNVQYEVVFWNDRERQEIWVGAWEVSSDSGMAAINSIL